MPNMRPILRDNLVFASGTASLNLTMNPLGELPLLDLVVPVNTPEFDLTFNVGGFVGKVPEPSTLIGLCIIGVALLRTRGSSRRSHRAGPDYPA